MILVDFGGTETLVESSISWHHFYQLIILSCLQAGDVTGVLAVLAVPP